MNTSAKLNFAVSTLVKEGQLTGQEQARLKGECVGVGARRGEGIGDVVTKKNRKKK